MLSKTIPLIILISFVYYFVFVYTTPVLVYTKDIEKNIVSKVTIPDKISEKIKKMTLEEKVGQLFLVGIYSEDSNLVLEKLIKTKKIGSVILMSKNVTNKNVKQVSSQLQKASSATNTVPLLISIDQEGGIVARIKEPGSNLTAQPAIRSVEEAYSVAKERGMELKSKGVNVNFSPVLEYISSSTSFLYKRVFRGSKEDLIAYGSSMVRGYNDAGIISAIKHFPGHDDFSVDSHKSLPTSNVTKENFQEYTRVFKEVIKNENPKMIMMAHIFLPNIDNKYPATLSSTIINYLRNDYKYKGVIITDDMNMGAITDNYGVEEGAISAIHAGNDLLLYVATPDIINRAYNGVIAAVKNKQLSEKRIDDSVYRILKLKDEME